VVQLGIGRSGLHEDGPKESAANLEGLVHRQPNTCSMGGSMPPRRLQMATLHSSASRQLEFVSVPTRR
jgi:hypothetical protein